MSGHSACVCVWKKRKSSIRGLPAERRHAQASAANVYQHQSVPLITPHTVESLRNPLSGFRWSQLVQVWDVTEGRHRNKEAQLTSFSLSHSAVSPLPPASLSCLKWHRWLLYKAQRLRVNSECQKHRPPVCSLRCDGLILKVLPLQGKCHPDL